MPRSAGANLWCMDGTDEAPNLLTILVDAVLPLLKPYEFSLYMLLLRHTNLAVTA